MNVDGSFGLGIGMSSYLCIMIGLWFLSCAVCYGPLCVLVLSSRLSVFLFAALRMTAFLSVLWVYARCGCD